MDRTMDCMYGAPQGQEVRKAVENSQAEGFEQSLSEEQ
jgi:hypothetical protein